MHEAKKLIKKCLIMFVFLTTVLSSNDEIEKSGDFLLVFMPLSAFGGSYYIDDEDGMMELFKSLMTTGVATDLLKRTTHKKRPDGEDFRSFPSGHTSITFATAAYIHKRYGLMESFLPYLAASYVGHSRIYSKRHYAEDVVAGAAIGILSSFYFTEKNESFRVTPLAGKGFYGVRFTLRL